jgi:hypothetical protein
MQDRSGLNEVSNQLQACGVPVKDKRYSYNNLHHDLALYIDYLITNDFIKLVQLLYQIDISEDGVRQLLKEQSDKPASNFIAKLIIERLQKKIQLRASFKRDENIDENERW